MARKLLIFLICLVSSTRFGSFFRNYGSDDEDKVQVHPQNATVKEGASAILECKLHVVVTECSWKKDSENLLMKHHDIVYVQNGYHYSPTYTKDCSIKIRAFEWNHIGCYHCFGKRFYGSIAAKSHRACLKPLKEAQSCSAALTGTIIGLLFALVIVAILTYYLGWKRGLRRTERMLPQQLSCLYLPKESNQVISEIDKNFSMKF